MRSLANRWSTATRFRPSRRAKESTAVASPSADTAVSCCPLFLRGVEKFYGKVPRSDGAQSVCGVVKHCEGEKSRMQLKGRGKSFRLSVAMADEWLLLLLASASIPFFDQTRWKLCPCLAGRRRPPMHTSFLCASVTAFCAAKKAHVPVGR